MIISRLSCVRPAVSGTLDFRYRPMGFFSSPEDRKTLVLVEQLSATVPTIISYQTSILNNQAMVLNALNALVSDQATLREEIDQFMSTINTANATLAAQLQAAAQQITDQETKIESDLAALSSAQSSALSDLKAALSGNAATTIDPAMLTQLQSAVAKFETVDTTLQTLTAAATSADPGAPTPVPVA